MMSRRKAVGGDDTLLLVHVGAFGLVYVILIIAHKVSIKGRFLVRF